MTAHIYQEDLDFLEEAKREFSLHPELSTYMNAEETLIALRIGFNRVNILIYKIDEELLHVLNVLDAAPNLVLESEEIK
ncbi:hypothetical protein [Sporosarcina sp. FA9]|uniref:hypothetical protein n=1 Tax=Sporosarcina sp. FA9 TaxID=3413030 RepID=UPI003F660585